MQFAIDPEAYGPTDYLTREQVEDDCEIQPAFVRTDISDIRDRDLIECLDIKVLLESVVGNDSGFAIMLGSAAVSHLNPQSLLLHQAINAMLAAGFAKITQVVDNKSMT